jgi:hypothetical protein
MLEYRMSLVIFNAGGDVKAREGGRTTKPVDEFRYFRFRIASLNLLNTYQ